MHKIKKNFTVQKVLLAFGIAFLSTFCLMSAVDHITAYAADGNGGDIKHPGDLKNHNGEGYPSSSKTGWLIYLYKYEEGSTPYTPILVPTGNLSGNAQLSTVFGVGCGGKKSNSFGIDPPWTSNQTPNGTKVKNGLISEGCSYYWAHVVEGLWGKSVLDKVNEEPDKYYLVCEVVMAHAVTPGAGGGSNKTIATVHNWAKIDMAAGKPPRGDGRTGWCDNAVAPDSAYLDRNWPGLPSMPTVHATSKYSDGGRLESSLVGNTSLGYGMVAVRLKDEAIHTYWEPHGSPGKEEPAPPNKIGKYNMVKVYYTKYMKNGALEREEQDGAPYVELNCVPTISVDDEPNEWHLEHWSSNTDLNTGIGYAAVRSMHGPQSGDGAKIIRLSKEERNEKTVYVVLVRIKDDKEPEEYNYLMTQSMITRTIWLNYPDHKLSMKLPSEIDFTWESPEHPDPEDHCDHPHTHEGEDEDGNACDVPANFQCSNRKWVERIIRFSLWNDNKYDYPKILATKDDWSGTHNEVKDQDEYEGKRYEPEDSLHRNYRDTFDKDTRPTSQEDKDWDYVCVIMRGADKLTVAQTANEGGWIVNATAANDDLADASDEGFAVADTKTGTRKTDDYYEHFNLVMNQDNGHGCDYKTKVTYTKRTCPECGETFGPCYDTQEYVLLNTLSTHVVVKVETYSGNPNGGWEDLSLDSSDKIVKPAGLPGWEDSSVNHHSGRMVNAGNKISFLPYVLMKYQTLTSGYDGWHDTLNNMYDGWLKAYVLGQYMRSINPNDYAEIHWDRKYDTPNMQLLSNQWSVHALATNCWGVDNVLPGGATLSLKIKSNDRQKVYVTTLQCYTEGYGRDQCEKTGGDPGSITRADCEATHLAFVNEVADSLDNTNVQQWQRDIGSTNTAANSDQAWTGNGIKVNRSESLSPLKTSGKRSSDDEKYYFGDMVSGSNKGDYDVKIDPVDVHTYTFYSDVNGAIHMTIDNTSPGMYDDDGAYSAIANAINERTYVRDKLIAAVEQATEGDDLHENTKECKDDKALNGEKWYNEEFDGITVIVQEHVITTGFLDPAERTEVLDPKLTQTMDSKGNQFYMHDADGNATSKAEQQKHYECGQFKTREYSESWGEDNPEVLASFKGSTVRMHELEYLYWTRKFWIPNFTVQDIY